VKEFAPKSCQLTREWLEFTGPKAKCTPCADIALAHFAQVLSAKLIEKPCFFAFWPEYYSLAGYKVTEPQCVYVCVSVDIVLAHFANVLGARMVETPCVYICVCVCVYIYIYI
jgi:hypothetical protein